MDGYILLWIQDNLRTPVFNSIFRFITHLGDGGVIWIILAWALIFIKKTRKAGVCSLSALFVMLIGNEFVLKHIVNRTRPFDAIDGLVTLIKHPTSSSFPSGHTSSAFAVVIVLLILIPMKYSIWSLVLALTIAFSRMYVGVHYPTDILGGIMVGLIYGFVGYKIGSFAFDSGHKLT